MTTSTQTNNTSQIYTITHVTKMEYKSQQYVQISPRERQQLCNATWIRANVENAIQIARYGIN